jgi:hypothetical protein
VDNLDGRLAVLSERAALDGAAVVEVEQLHAVADAEHGQPQPEHLKPHEPNQRSPAAPPTDEQVELAAVRTSLSSCGALGS